jgi:uncharacterized protein YbaP (TraB family)
LALVIEWRIMSGMKHILKALLVVGLLAGLACAAVAQQVQPALPPGIMAFPSLWHVKTDQGEVYLLGSVHVLPPNLHWQSPVISRALSRSDVYVFEVSQDETAVAQLNALIQAQGFLPPGTSLRASLHPAARADYDAAVAMAGLPPAMIEHERPWLAGIQLMFAQIAKLKFATSSGVDSVLMAEAADQHKRACYLETITEQFALMAPADRSLEMEEFESGLKDLRDVAGGIQPMVDAWSAGDQKKLDRLINGELDEFPEARKLLLDDRNQNWLPKIEAMLKEKHVFFVTVGAGHLTGPAGLPSLLRKAGYEVEGP